MKVCLDDSSTVVQKLTLIGATVAEISVPAQISRQPNNTDTPDLISDNTHASVAFVG